VYSKNSAKMIPNLREARNILGLNANRIALHFYSIRAIASRVV
jgi:hypothetical protein